MDNISTILKNSIVILRFKRKHPKPGFNITRKMICTNKSSFLMSEFGRMTLNFRPTKNPPAYDPKAYGLICVWDILMQDYRNIPINCLIIREFKTDEEFINYFKKEILPLNASQKINFQDS